MEKKFLIILTLVLIMALVFIAIFNITVIEKNSSETGIDSQIINNSEKNNLIDEVYPENFLENTEFENEE